MLNRARESQILINHFSTDERGYPSLQIRGPRCKCTAPDRYLFSYKFAIHSDEFVIKFH